MAKIIKTGTDGKLSPEDLKELAAAVKACKIVAFPTDTVYGIGSTGLIKAAVRRIYQVKGRDALKPLPILVQSSQEAQKWVVWNAEAETLARAFWPGAMTLVLRPTHEGRLLTFQEFPTLAIRVPAHPAILGLIEAAGTPLASTSANVSGQPALSSGTAIAEALGARIDYVIDAGERPGTESTVVDLSSRPARVLREGKIAKDDILKPLASIS